MLLTSTIEVLPACECLLQGVESQGNVCLTPVGIHCDHHIKVMTQCMVAFTQAAVHVHQRHVPGSLLSPTLAGRSAAARKEAFTLDLDNIDDDHLKDYADTDDDLDAYDYCVD